MDIFADTSLKNWFYYCCNRVVLASDENTNFNLTKLRIGMIQYSKDGIDFS